MARGKVKISWITNQKARQVGYKKRMQGLIKKAHELTILCDVSACLMFYSPDDKQLVTWPSQEEAKSLLDKYFSLPPNGRNVNKAVDQESFIIENIKKIEKNLANIRKALTEYEMDDLMFQLQNGGRLDDLTDIEVNKLITYSNNKIVSLRRELGHRNHCNPRIVNEPYHMGDETPRPSNVEPELENGTIYYIDRWVPLNEAPLPQMVSQFNLNRDSSNGKDVETPKWYPGESNKYGGADDA